MKTINGTNYTYLPEERETHLRYDYVDKAWYAWSCIPKHIDQMKKQGWTVTSEDQYATYLTAPAHAVKIMPAEKKKRQMTDAQREALKKNGFASRKHDDEKTRDNNANETLNKTA